MANLIPLKIKDFSGGMSDYYVGGDTLNKCEDLENFYINENQDAITRPGCRSAYDVRVDNTNTIRSIVDNQGEILLQTATEVKYVDNTDTVQIIQPVSGNDVFTTGDDDMTASFTYWNKHTIAASDSFAPLQKIHKDAGGNWTASNLGLPEVIYPTCLLLANELKANFNAHIADAAMHPTPDTASAILSDDAEDFASLFTLTGELLAKYQAHQNDADLSSAWAYHAGQQAASNKIASITKPETLFGVYGALKGLQAAFNAHDAEATAHTVASNHQATQAVLSITGTAGANTYIYALHFTYRYQIEDTTFVERSTVELVTVENVAAPDLSAVTINNIPTLVSGAKNNWDDSNIQVSIFRTINSGGTLFFVGEITNGVTSFVDTIGDDTLTTRPTSYIEGGVVDNDMPPPAKFAEVVNDTLVLGYVLEGDSAKGNKVRICRTGIPSAAPEDFFPEPFEDEVTGLSSVGIYPIVFLKNAVYRLEGFFDSVGRGGYVKRAISQRIGCLSAKSIVKTERGVYWCSESGIYFTDGFQLKNISTDINLRTYPSLYNKNKIQGCHDKKANRILWSVQTTDVNVTENNTLFVAHVEYQTNFNGHPFSRWNGGRDAQNFTATAVAFVGDRVYRADQRGYLLYHSDAFADDAYVDVSKTPSDWGTQTIFYKMTSPAFDFGIADARKWVSKIIINAENATSLSLQIDSANDRSGAYAQLVPVIKKGASEWGDPTVVWGVSDLRWNYFPVISEWRHFPAATQNLRCQYKSVRFQNAYSTIDTSDFAGPVSITPASLTTTVTLLSHPAKGWISDAVNYYISFEHENYENEYLITGISGADLTIADDSNLLTAQASTGWRIRGYQKREILNLLNYSLMFVPITMTQDTVRTGA
jgi:hypothetical protein